jgi:hypothetical protein
MREQEILRLANLWRVPPNAIRRLSEDRRSLLLQLTIQYGVEGGNIRDKIVVRKDLSPRGNIRDKIVVREDLSPIKWVKNHKL